MNPDLCDLIEDRTVPVRCIAFDQKRGQESKLY